MRPLPMPPSIVARPPLANETPMTAEHPLRAVASADAPRRCVLHEDDAARDPEGKGHMCAAHADLACAMFDKDAAIDDAATVLQAGGCSTNFDLMHMSNKQPLARCLRPSMHGVTRKLSTRPGCPRSGPVRAARN